MILKSNYNNLLFCRLKTKFKPRINFEEQMNDIEFVVNQQL